MVKELLVSESLLYAAALQAAYLGLASPCWLFREMLKIWSELF